MEAIKTSVNIEVKEAIVASVPASTSSSWFSRMSDKFEQERFAWMVVYMIISSCLGSIACLYVLKNSSSELMLVSCAAVSMLANSLLIAQAPARWCLVGFYLSLLVNGILIVVNFS